MTRVILAQTQDKRLAESWEPLDVLRSKGGTYFLVIRDRTHGCRTNRYVELSGQGFVGQVAGELCIRDAMLYNPVKVGVLEVTD